MLILPGEALTRRQFFARLRALGYAKSRIQMTRIGLTYVKEDADFGRITVTVPKYHESTFTILGDVPYSGIFVEKTEGREPNWGISVDISALGFENMLEVCLGLCSGDIEMKKAPDPE
jgi:hypothetical protein